MQSSSTKFKIDLKVRAYYYGLEVIKFISGLSREDQVCQVIGKQLLRSGTSIGANIIEAQASSSRKDFANYLNHSLKSANESKFWLGLLRDSAKVKEESVATLLQETREIANILAKSILTIRSSKGQ